ncbi:MAG: AsmA family protein [Verrucomicrobiales bacterium]
MSQAKLSVLTQVSDTRRSKGRVRRWLRRLLIGIPLVAVAGLLFVNLLLMLPPVKKRITHSVSAVVGAATHVDRITWSPWAGVRARNVRIAALKEATAVTDAPFFESDTAWIKVRTLQLFKGVLDVEEVGIDSPRIACVRAADGRLLLPFNGGLPAVVMAAPLPADGVGAPPGDATPEMPPPGDESGAEVRERKAPPSGENNQVTTQTPQPSAPVAQRRSLEVRLGELVIREGKVTLLGDPGGKGLGELRDFQMHLDMSGRKAGTFEATGATVLGKLEFTKIGGNVTASPNGFEFRDAVATCDKGAVRISGLANLGLTTPGIPFAVDLRTEGLKPAAFLKTDVPVDPNTQTLLDKEIVVGVQIRGFARALNSVAGVVQVSGLQIPVADVQPAFSLEGSAFERAGDLDFEIARIRFHLNNGGIALDDVNFNADSVVLRAAGNITSSGALNVAIRTYVPATAVSAIGTFMRGWPRYRLMNFMGLENTTYIYRDMLVQGTISEPAVDAWGDGTFYTVPALLDEVRELREAGKAAEMNAVPPGDSESTELVPLPSRPEPERTGGSQE